ncbi:MAG: hypothetical protein COB02_05270 [Candidatus Cloacimonadota bacterium]|nr:MAG: hypothetical protein COB02_05270 [Candidatus Cloacimonadota bacterium]
MLQYEQKFKDLFCRKKYKELKILLDEASSSEQLDEIVIQEKVLLRLIQSDMQIEKIVNFSFYDKENPQECLEKITLLLIERLHLKEALHLLQNYILLNFETKIANSLYQKYKSNLKNDYYYKYYGYFIMLLQVFTTGLVLSVSIYFVEQAFHSIPAFIYYILTLWALIPVFYINVIMIKDRLIKSDKCYTEIHDKGILISHHGELHFLSKDKNIYLYQDDNDYSFIALIRHLPFVPNFTYIRAYDYFLDEMMTLPLYGVSDGRLFKEKFIKKDSIKDLNMIGVRVGQLQNFLGDWSRLFKFVGASLSSVSFVCLYLSVLSPQIMQKLYGYIVLSSESNFFSYLKSQSSVLFYSQFNSYQFQEQLFYCGIFLFGIILYNSKKIANNFVNDIFEIPLVNSFLQFSIVRGGIVFIASLFLFNHYGEYYKGYIPVILGTAWFYLVFVKTKYEKEVKELVAVLSSHREEIINNNQNICREYDINHISFPIKSRFTFRTKYLFFDLNNIISSVRFLGYTLRYDVQNLSNIDSIKLYDLNKRTKIEIGDWKFISSFSIECLKIGFIAKGFKVETLDYTPTLNDTFEKIFRLDIIQVILIVAFFGLIMITGSIIPIASTLFIAVFVIFISKVIFRLEWILLGCFLLYQVDLMKYRQDQEDFSKVFTSFKQFNDKSKSLDLDLTKLKVKYSYKRKKVTFFEPQMTYLEYENYLRLHPEKDLKIVPPFIHANSPREEAIDILYWHMIQKNEIFSYYKYGSSLTEYCQSRGLQVISSTDSCGFVIDMKKMSESQILWDTLSYGDTKVINHFPANFLVEALKQDPNLFYIIPNYLKKINKAYDLVKLKHLKELIKSPEKLKHCHKSLLSDKSFLRDFILLLLKGKKNISNKTLKIIEKILLSNNIDNLYGVDTADLKKGKIFEDMPDFWLELEKLSPVYLQVYNHVTKESLSQSDFQKTKMRLSLANGSYLIKRKIESTFLASPKHTMLYELYMNNQKLNFDKIKDDKKYYPLVYELALNHKYAKKRLSKYWKNVYSINIVLRDEKILLSRVLEKKKKFVNRKYFGSTIQAISSKHLRELLFHPKIEIDRIKSFINFKLKRNFKRDSIWSNNILPYVKGLSKKQEIARLDKQNKDSNPAFLRRLKRLEMDGIKIKPTDKIFYYSMLKDNWKLILKDGFLIKDRDAYLLIRPQVKKDIYTSKVDLKELPKEIQDLF